MSSGRLQIVAALALAASALAAQAAPDAPSGPALALAGSTLKIPPGWSASLFVGHRDPEIRVVPGTSAPVPPVNARVARKLSKSSRVELEVFNMLDKRPPGNDDFTGARLFGAPQTATGSVLPPVESRTFVLSFKKTF